MTKGHVSIHNKTVWKNNNNNNKRGKEQPIPPYHNTQSSYLLLLTLSKEHYSCSICVQALWRGLPKIGPYVWLCLSLRNGFINALSLLKNHTPMLICSLVPCSADAHEARRSLGRIESNLLAENKFGFIGGRYFTNIRILIKCEILKKYIKGSKIFNDD